MTRAITIGMLQMGMAMFGLFLAIYFAMSSLTSMSEDRDKARDTTTTMLDEDYGLKLTHANLGSLSQGRITPVEVMHDQHHYSDIYAVRYDNDTDTATLIMTHSESAIPAPTPEQLREQVGNP